MTRSAAPRGRLVSAHQLGLIITCWNAWAAGDTWDGTVFGPDDSMPDICRITAALARMPDGPCEGMPQ
jgi:hypothetical protein